MRILIVGSGCAGGLIGARLIEKKCDVTFLVRLQRKSQLLTTGLVLHSHYGKFRRPVAAITPNELRGIYDLIIIACRAMDYDSVLEMLVFSIGPETMVVPVLEGANHLRRDLVPNGGRLIGGVLEARIVLDADGVLHQRMPGAELHIGAMDPFDDLAARQIAALLDGRGIKSISSVRIEAAIWERYCFTAAAVATNVRTGLSLRDAVRPTHHVTSFDVLLREGILIGEAIGLQPRHEYVMRYRHGFRMETRPVQPPALVNGAGRGSDEAVFLLFEMVAIAERAGVPVPKLRAARDDLLRPREITLAADDVTTDAAE